MSTTTSQIRRMHMIELNEKVLAGMKHHMNKLANGSTLQQGPARNRLNKLARKFPLEAKAAGWVAEAPIMNRVYVYGCLSAPRVFQEEYSEAAALQMRLRHQYWNELVLATTPLYRRYLSLMKKFPVTAKLFELRSKVRKAEQAISDEIVATKKEGLAQRTMRLNERITSPTIERNRARIKENREMMSRLRKELSQERPFYRDSKEKADLDLRVREVCKQVAQSVRARGLYSPNCDAVTMQFNTAFGNALAAEAPEEVELQCKYQSRDGSVPADMSTWTKWDGVGHLNIIESHKGRPNTFIASMFDGTNTMVRLRRLTADDWKRFEQNRPIDFTSKKSQRLHLMELRVGSSEGASPIWCAVPIVLHRPFPEGASLSGAQIVSRRDGLKNTWQAAFTIAFPAPKLPARNAKKVRASIALTIGEHATQFATFEREDGTRFQRWMKTTIEGKRHAEWLGPDGTMHVLSHTTYADGMNERLAEVLSRHFNSASQALKELIDEGVKLPKWYAEEEHQVFTKKGIRRCFRSWRSHLFAEAESEGRRAVERVRKTFSDARRAGREALDSEKDMDLITVAVMDELRETFNLTKGQTRFLAICTLFTERFEHLFPWGVNLRSKSLRHRKHNYRVFANYFLDGVTELTLPKANLRTRRMSDVQRASAPAELLTALKHAADRMGIAVKEIKAAKKEEEAVAA